MLDKDALSQLRQLKKEIHHSKERVEGVVRGSQKRFGFVRLDDGRDIFLPPDEMQKVLPGDRVRVSVVSAGDGKTSGEIEKLVDSPLTTFTGQYTTRGQGHFVDPDLPRFGKLLFLPPGERGKAKPGDLLLCRLTRHPIRDGRAQAQILKNLGAPEQPGIEAEYTVAKLGLPTGWTAEELASPTEDSAAAQREDLRNIPFVTIDSAETRDLDDALYAEVTPEGWRVMVAVADPTAFIPEGSPLDRTAMARGSTVYMPGRIIPMLPEELSNDRCSLVAAADRTALVCDMQINADGSLGSYRFRQAVIHSQAKLSYGEVAAHLTGNSALPYASLELLYQACRAMLDHRRRHHLVLGDQVDYRLILNERGKVENIVRIERNEAHKLVEECMIAANRCAADWLGDIPALFMTHSGIREDRIDNVRALLGVELPDAAEADFTTLPGYIDLIRALETSDSEAPLQSIVSRMLERGLLSAEVLPHHGLGFERYTTCTSPLRKYSDFLVHRYLRARLEGRSLAPPSPETLAALQQSLARARQAGNEVEQWLKCQYLQDKKDRVFDAHIVHVNGGGFTVRLDDTGIQGFVDVRSIPGKLSFDPNFLRLSNDSVCYQLDTAVHVKVDAIDEQRRSINFVLASPDI